MSEPASDAAKRAKQEAEHKIATEALERSRREADREHRGSINRTAMTALVDGGVDEVTAKKVVTLIAAGSVPAVSIHY